tara:strand:+ start:2024 stop:2584 length:561 start_codon:yes stop_codon:yes gene_type:complete
VRVLAARRHRVATGTRYGWAEKRYFRGFFALFETWHEIRLYDVHRNSATIAHLRGRFMPSLDQALGIHPQAMKLRAYRAQVLAANLANAETPNYRARDVDFRSALRDADPTTRLAATRPGHFSDAAPGFGGIDLQYREPTQASLDQNTVDVAAERARFVDNSLRYQASLRFLDGKLSGIKSALRGE